MPARSQLYDTTAALLAYPQQGYLERLARCAEAMGENHAAAAALLEPALEVMEKLSVEEIQELFTRVFDINPVCTLEVGWHIYGEDYARGSLLVKMRALLRQHNVTESCELPDHLTHVLAVLGRLEGDEADDLAARYVLPSLDKMLTAMKDDDGPYKAILEAVASVVRSDHDVEVMVPRERRSDPPGWATPLPRRRESHDAR